MYVVSVQWDTTREHAATLPSVLPVTDEIVQMHDDGVKNIRETLTDRYCALITECVIQKTDCMKYITKGEDENKEYAAFDPRSGNFAEWTLDKRKATVFYDDRHAYISRQQCDGDGFEQVPVLGLNGFMKEQRTAEKISTEDLISELKYRGYKVTIEKPKGKEQSERSNIEYV